MEKIDSFSKFINDICNENMCVGTANITVKVTGSDGKVYSIVIPISVKLGTPTFTLSHASSRKARTFTVTTSTGNTVLFPFRDAFVCKASCRWRVICMKKWGAQNPVRS